MSARESAAAATVQMSNGAVLCAMLALHSALTDRDAVRALNVYADLVDALGAHTTELRAAFERTVAAREAVTARLDEMEAAYPLDVFPPPGPGCAPDRYGAAMARHVVAQLRAVLAATEPTS